MLRGVAAIVVMLWHTLLAFRPSASGIFANGPADSLQTSLAFVLFNGLSAVYLFFVMSAFVLVKRYSGTRKMQDLLLGAAKRLPRLAGPVLLTVLASCALYRLDLYFFKQAGALSGSPWLAAFGYATPVLSPTTASFSDAFMQGAWRTFIFGDSYYDSSLWTMWFEFWGSLMTFALASFVFFLHDRSAVLSWCVVGISIILAWLVNFVLVAFPLGLSLHLLVAGKFRLNVWSRAFVVALSLALLGYGGNAVGVYRPLAVLDVDGFPVNMRQPCVAILASVMLVYAVLTIKNPPAWLSGKAAHILGDLSFPL
ncbi:acyltransferase family protein, partial [Mesorhizobium calcicola]